MIGELPLTPEQIVLLAQVGNTLVLGLLSVGLWHRFRPRIHIPVMLTSFLLDLIIVVLVEIGARVKPGDGAGAVEQGLRSLVERPVSLLNFHIIVSVGVIACYIVALTTGIRLYRRGLGRRLHRGNAYLFVVFRLTNWATSFFV
jgi:hypothetical protein